MDRAVFLCGHKYDNKANRVPRRARGRREGSFSGFKGHSMKTPEYIEGPEALENFKRGMIALFKVPKKAIRIPNATIAITAKHWIEANRS
jgi:hypothetical protein